MSTKTKRYYHIQDQYRKNTYISDEDRQKFADAAEKCGKADESNGVYIGFKCPLCGEIALLTWRINGDIKAVCPGCKCDYDRKLHPQFAPREWEEG